MITRSGTSGAASHNCFFGTNVKGLHQILRLTIDSRLEFSLMNKRPVILSFCALLSACGTQPVDPSPSHIKEIARPGGSIPEPVRQSVSLSPPKATPKIETY